MKLYRTSQGPYVEIEGNYYLVPSASWDTLVTHDNLHGHLRSVADEVEPSIDFSSAEVLAPIESQEVWAAGVTYFRSRNARVAESKEAGGGTFYDRVYSADRPELFFKSAPSRVVGTGGAVRIRKDASWSVPEPELALLINQHGKIIGYTAGNDMSSRDIEGENPLYLPQAKVYNGSCALGPCVHVSSNPLPPSTSITLEILRNGTGAFSGTTTLAELKRDPVVLVEYLYREISFPFGCFLMTGTGIIPPDTFTLKSGDEIRVTIQPIGTLVNFVAPSN